MKRRRIARPAPAPLLAALVVALVVALPAAAGGGEPTVVNFDADNPPFMSAQDGRPAGLYPTIVAAAYTRCNAGVRLELRPWKRALAELDYAQAGVGGIYKNAERLQKYDFSEPLFVENIVVYLNAAHPFVYRQIADLYGKRVGVIRAWSYGDAFDTARREGKIAVEEVGSDRLNFRKLGERRLDAVLAVEQAGHALVAGGLPYAVVAAPAYLASNPAYLAFNKLAHQTAALDCFNHALAAMRRDGTLARLIHQQLPR